MRKAFPTEFVGTLAIGFAVMAATPSVADYIPPCQTIPAGVSVISRLEDAPASLVRALTDRVGEIVAVGAPFDNTDRVQTGKNRRLIFIWNRGTRWVVATEHGGRGYNDPIFAFEIDKQNRVTLVRDKWAIPYSVCSTATSLIEDHPTK